MVAPAARRKAVAYLRETFEMSERRACTVLGCCRMTMRYQGSRVDDVDLRDRMKAIAHERRRFGYRRLHVLLRREGYVVNHKRLFRMYREEKLSVRRSGCRKRALGTRAPMMIPTAPNERWSLDFVSDQLTDGRRFRVLGLGWPHFYAAKKVDGSVVFLWQGRVICRTSAFESLGILMDPR